MTWYNIDWGDPIEKRSKNYNIRKICYFILLSLMLIGYGFLVISNAFVSLSVMGMRIYPVGDDMSYTNESVDFSIDLMIQNDHANSIDIQNLDVNFSMYSENNTHIITLNYSKDIIPRLSNTTLNIGFSLNLADLSTDTILILTNSSNLKIKFVIGVQYWLYYVRFGTSFMVGV